MVVVSVIRPMVGRMLAVGADAPHVVMVPHLGRADVAFVADDLLAVLAEGAVHLVVAGEDLFHPVDEGVDHVVVVAQVSGLEDLHLRVGGGGGVRPVVDAAHQDSGKQEAAYKG